MTYTKQNLIDAFCRKQGYSETILSEKEIISNPETKVEFVQKQMKIWAKGQALKQLKRENDSEVNAEASGIEF